jgi:Rrf2 family protein
MSITKKTEYALRALYEISVTGNSKPISRRVISQNQLISEHFLEKILMDLFKAGITRSIRGPGGGFVLNKKESDITVWDVYTTVENKKHIYEKCAKISNKNCELYQRCKISYIWPKINQAFKKSLADISLQDITNRGLSQASTDNPKRRKNV